MKKFAQSLLELWKQLGLNQRVSLVVAALAVSGGLIGVVLWSQRPDYQLLYARMGDKDATAVISYLESQNIPHKVTAGGTAVQVPASMVYKLRMDLASKGLPSGEGVGFEIFDKGQFGLSDFVQRTNFIRAMQGELARTIMQLQGVRSARVMIVQPENRLLLTEQGVKSTASVFVDVGGGRLEIDQVNAIRHLVANAVQGLTPDQVAVIDNRGRTLSEELKQDPTLGTASSQIRYREQVEEYFAKKVESMLAAVIGPGNAVVRVSADIETDATTMNSEKWNPDGQVVRSQTETADSTNSRETRAGGGATGVSANVPEKAQTAPEAARPLNESTQERKNKTLTYEIDVTRTSVTRTPGAIKNLTASVIIAKRPVKAAASAAGRADATAAAPVVAPSRTPQEMEQLRQVVMNALGVKPAAGQSPDQVVTLQEAEFQQPDLTADQATTPMETRVENWVEVASRWGAVGGAVLVLLMFWRLFKRQKPEPVPIEVLAMTPDQASGSLSNTSNVTPELLNELIRQKPANIGVALREWVTAGSSNVPASKN
jgi:flagellar M-ring protein FliF